MGRKSEWDLSKWVSTWNFIAQTINIIEKGIGIFNCVIVKSINERTLLMLFLDRFSKCQCCSHNILCSSVATELDELVDWKLFLFERIPKIIYWRIFDGFWVKCLEHITEKSQLIVVGVYWVSVSILSTNTRWIANKWIIDFCALARTLYGLWRDILFLWFAFNSMSSLRVFRFLSM